MTKQVQRRRGTATQHTSFTGAEGEISVNTTNKSVHVHDGVTAGGVEAARADLSNVSDANLNTALSGNTLSSLTITSADINGGTIDGVTIGGASAGAGTFTSITGTSLDMNGNADFGGNITLSKASSSAFTRTDDTGVVIISGGSGTALGANIVLYGQSHVSLPNTVFFEGDTMSFRPVDDTPEFMRFVDGTGAVFNETGADLDFRIESDTNANAFFLRGSDGFTGIGTASPRSQVHIYGDAQNTSAITDAGAMGGMLRLSDSGTGTGAGGGIIFAENYADVASSAGMAAIKGLLHNGSNNTTGNLAFSTRAATTDTALTERMRLTWDGNVGIGTESPAQKLDVNGAIRGTGFSTPGATYSIDYMDQNVNWTPTLVSSVGGETITYTVNSGQYCRYGEWVTCTGRIVVASVSGGSGTASIGGLPFTTVNASIAQGTLQVGLASGWVGTAPQMGGTPQNTVTCALKYFNGTQTSSIGWAGVQAGTTLWFTIIYRAA